MGITYGDHLIDSGYREMTEDQEREMVDRQSEEKQAREMSAVGDLRTCQDCGAWVCYFWPKKEWPGHLTPCGRWAIAPQSCPEELRIRR